MEKYVRALQEDQIDFLDEENVDIFLYLLYGTSVLIGSYTDSEEARTYKEKYLEIIKKSPPLLAYTIYNLEQSLVEREIRRAGVEDHQTGEADFKQRLVVDEFGIDPDLITKLHAKLADDTEDEN